MPLKGLPGPMNPADGRNQTPVGTKLTQEAEKEVIKLLARWVVDLLLKQNQEGGSG